MDRENPRFDDMQKYALSVEKEKKTEVKKSLRWFQEISPVNHFFFFFDSKSISYFAIMRDMIREINLHENANVICWIRI